MSYRAILLPLALSCSVLGACNSGFEALSQPSSPLYEAGSLPPDSRPVPTQPGSSQPVPTPGSSEPRPDPRHYQVDALLFVGKGTWTPEVQSLRAILADNDFSFEEATSSEMDALTDEDLGRYGMIVWPGGSGGTQTAGLRKSTRLRIRRAVQEQGVSFIGFCAGAWVAVAPKVAPGEDAEYGLGLVDGVVLDYYHPLEDQGVQVAMVDHVFADGSRRNVVWYGGPVTLGSGVVARYGDGLPAISQAWGGNGFVMTVATHPSAPQDVRDDWGVEDRDGLDFELSAELLTATLKRVPMREY